MAAAGATCTIIILIIYHIVCQNSAIAAAAGKNINGGFSVQLIRRNSPNSPFYNQKNKPFRRLMSPSNNPNIPQSEIKRDKDDGEGAQLMKLSIGTPPHDIYAVADTGSTLLWTQCEPCPKCYKQKNPKFDPKKSSSYKNLPCDAQECDITEDDSGYYSCSSIHGYKNVCSYNYSYLDDSGTRGVMAKETITLTSTSGTPVSFKNIVFGCGHNNTAIEHGENEMGVVGLGVSNLSFISQIAPYVGGRKFSHCFVPFDPDHPNVPSMISFGNGSEVSGEGVVSTPLITKEGQDQYFVTVDGISVGGKFVPFYAPGSNVSKGNMFLDSGTQVMTLPQDFYDRLIAQVKKAVGPMSLKPIEINDPRDGTLLCYNTTIDHLRGLKFTVHFDGGAKVPLAPKQTFFRNQTLKLLCFGVVNASATEASEDIYIYGSYAQSNFLIGFDLEKMMVSFKPTDCTKSATNSAVATPFSYFFTYFLSFLLIVTFSFYEVS